MSQLTFKQYSEALTIAMAGGECPDFLSEGPIWDKIKAVAKKTTAGKTEMKPEELEKLHALSIRGNVEARRDLDAYLKAKEKEGPLTGRAARVAAAHRHHSKNLETGFQQARSSTQEKPGAPKKRDTRWDPETRRWVHDWSEIGKHH